MLVMTVEPGFGGQAFMESQLETVRQVRLGSLTAITPGCDLEVDGGINPATVQSVVEAGANVLVAGSAVFGAADPPPPSPPCMAAPAEHALQPMTKRSFDHMQYLPPAMEKLVEQFARLPGIGSKSAQRLAFHVLSLPREAGRRVRPGHSGRQGQG